MCRVSYVMNVLNGEPFIKYQLQSIYYHAHEIIIVEGAYTKFSFATINGRSQDSTLQTITKFPDPDNKIRLVVNDGFYEDRLEMCNEFMHHITGDVIWQVDVDEFYHNATHEYVKNLFITNLDLDVVSFNFIDLFGSLKLRVDGLEGTSLQDVRRVHRYSKGDIWINQRPPTIGNIHKEEKVLRKVIRGDEMERDGHLMFNLTMLFEKQIQDKFLYYHSKDFSGPMTVWYETSIRKFQNQFNMLNFGGHLTYLKQLSCPLPEICIEIEKECLENHKYAFINDLEHKTKVTEPAYQNAIITAYQINTLPQNKSGPLDLTLRLFHIIKCMYTYFEPESRSFVFRVMVQKVYFSYKQILRNWIRNLGIK